METPFSDQRYECGTSGSTTGDVSRRDLFRTGGKVAALGGTLWLAGPTSLAADPSAERQDGTRSTVTVHEGTNIAAEMSPDGSTVAMDLYTGIWIVPAAGGPARRLTDDLQDASRPRFSPDSRTLLFQSYRDGNYHLWRIEVDGTGLRRLTFGRNDHREPRWSPDGRKIAFSSDRGGSYGIHVYDMEPGAITQVADTTERDEAEPAWSPDGERIVFTVDSRSIEEVVLSNGQRRQLVESVPDTQVFAPACGPDGRSLAYTRLHGATSAIVVDGTQVTDREDVFITGATWAGPRKLLYTADGRIRVRDLTTGDRHDIPFTATVGYRRREDRRPARDVDDVQPRQARGLASPVLSPSGQVAFRALGALWVMPIGERPRKITGTDAFSSDPDWFPDGRALVYSSDRAGTPDLWEHAVDTGAERRLTDFPGAQVTPRCSPDVNRIAYQDETGATWVLDLSTRQRRQVLPSLFQPGRPSWSPDGRVLALAAVKPYSRRFREGTSQILTVDLTTGELRYTEPLPFTGLSTRGDDGPVWSPDGRRMAFVINSLLHVVEVDQQGRFVGEPRPINDEVTDAPSWSGDSATLLYLNNGRLRLIPASGGRPRTIDVPLTWTRTRPRGRMVLRAGAVWDGRGTRLQRDVDVTIEGNRITALRPRDDRNPGADQVVDASHLTVMPGLIDAHVHWHLRGRYWGARQGRLWLAYGIMSTRSPGDPAYQMVETWEALESGAGLGPRYFGTGEAVDGSRIYYNFMRPTTGEEKLRRELSRAEALEYDLVKTYVRLPVESQRKVISLAARHRMPLSSHYLYPAVQLGMDGMEHTGATNRLGYSQTVSELGRAYSDVIELFARSKMSITPTLFHSKALYASDRSLVDDPRTRALFPPWEYAMLQAKADEASQPTPEAELAREALAANVHMLLRIHRGGGFLIAGTDAPLDNVAVSLHQNLRAMVQHGFTSHEALTTATGNPARWLGLGDQLGAVRPGFLADLALVDGDPLRDIRTAAAVRMVVTNGALHRVDDLVTDSRGQGDPPVSTPGRVTTTAPVEPRHYWWHGESESSLHLC